MFILTKNTRQHSAVLLYVVRRFRIIIRYFLDIYFARTTLVTYVAKDGNSYVSTVGEVTDGKAVLVSDNDYSVKGKYGETALLALLEPVGARFPKIPETTYTTIIKPWLLDVLVYQGGINSVIV